jgi:hypothetical protein
MLVGGIEKYMEIHHLLYSKMKPKNGKNILSKTTPDNLGN